MKLLKKISLLLAIAMMLGSLGLTALAADDDYIGELRVVNCEEWVSLRSWASTSASRVAKVPLGAVVDAYYHDYEFSLCCYNGDWGYILNDYLAIRYFTQVVNCDDWVSLRAAPRTSSSRVCKVPLGEYVEYYWYNPEFSLCYYNGARGYILNDYLDAYNY